MIAAKTAPAKERKRRSTLQGAPEPHATAKKRRGAATPSAGASAAAVSLPVASAGEDPHGRKPCNSGLVKQKSDSSSLLAQPLDWFFTEHSNRAPKVYEKVTTNDQFLQYQSEYKAKYETLLGLNKVLQEHKHLVKVLKKQGEEGHERILGLWRDKGAYLLAMDAAFKTLTKELIEIKGLARSFLEKLQRAK